MNAHAKLFCSPRGGAKHHHETYDSEIVRKTLDTTTAGAKAQFIQLLAGTSKLVP
jgi:hypothetical protein